MWNTDTDSAANELTKKSVSCTVERYGSHMIDCSVAKQSLIAAYSGEAEFYGIVRVVGQKANFTDLGADREAIRGDHCIRQQCGTRHVYKDRIRESATFFNQRVQLVSVDTLLNWADVGTKAHTLSARHRC